MIKLIKTSKYIFANDEDTLELAHLPLNGAERLPGIALLPELTIDPISFTRTNPVEGEMIWKGEWR